MLTKTTHHLVVGLIFSQCFLMPVSATPLKIKPPESLTAKQIYQKYNNAIVTIETDKGRGSGFFLTDGKYVVTCEHVLHGAKSIIVRDSEGNIIPIKKISLDQTSDSAVLITAVGQPHNSFYMATSDTVDPGDVVFVIGNPLGLTRSITQGILSGKRQDGDVKLLQITAPISPGSSGSPVINEYGAAVGIVSYTSTRGQAVNMAVAIFSIFQASNRGYRTVESFYADNGLVVPVANHDAVMRAEWGKLVANYAKVIRQDSKNADAYCGRANCYRELKQYDKAIADYAKAIRYKPDYLYSYEGMGQTYLALKQHDKAIAIYTEAIRVAPEDPAFTIYDDLNRIYIDLKKYDEAIAYYTKIIARKPSSSWVYSARGDIYRENKQYDESIADYTEAIRLKPNNIYASGDYYNRAIGYHMTKQYDKAIADFRRFIELAPNSYGVESARDVISYLETLK